MGDIKPRVSSPVAVEIGSCYSNGGPLPEAKDSFSMRQLENKVANG